MSSSGGGDGGDDSSNGGGDNSSGGDGGGGNVESCDYKMRVYLNMENIFRSIDLNDLQSFTMGPTELAELADYLRNGIYDLVDANGTIIDIVNQAVTGRVGDKDSWMSGIQQKRWSSRANISQSTQSAVGVANQHFLFEQDNGFDGHMIYSVPRGGIHDKLIRTHFHHRSDMFKMSFPNYWQVTAVMTRGFCDYQNKIAIHDTDLFTDVYHEALTNMVYDAINDSNFRSVVQTYHQQNNQNNGSSSGGWGNWGRGSSSSSSSSSSRGWGGGSGQDIVDLTDFMLDFVINYRYTIITNANQPPSLYNNICPDSGSTAMPNITPIKLCLTLIHQI